MIWGTLAETFWAVDNQARRKMGAARCKARPIAAWRTEGPRDRGTEASGELTPPVIHQGGF